MDVRAAWLTKATFTADWCSQASGSKEVYVLQASKSLFRYSPGLSIFPCITWLTLDKFVGRLAASPYHLEAPHQNLAVDLEPLLTFNSVKNPSWVKVKGKSPLKPAWT